MTQPGASGTLAGMATKRARRKPEVIRLQTDLKRTLQRKLRTVKSQPARKAA